MLAVASSGGCFLFRGSASALGLFGQVGWLRPLQRQPPAYTSQMLQSWAEGGAQGSTGIIYTPRHSADAATLQRTLQRPSRLLGTSSAVPPHREVADSGELKSPLTPPNNDNALAEARRLARFDEEGEYRVFRELLEGKKTRFVSRVSYDGTKFNGFQLQNGLPTVQVRQ